MKSKNVFPKLPLAEAARYQAVRSQAARYRAARLAAALLLLVLSSLSSYPAQARSAPPSQVTFLTSQVTFLTSQVTFLTSQSPSVASRSFSPLSQTLSLTGQALSLAGLSAYPQAQSALSGAWQCLGDSPAYPCPHAITAAAMLSASDGWAVGDDGVILHWNGYRWSSFPSPVTGNFTALAMLSPSDGWAAGYRPLWMPAGGYFQFFGYLLHWDGATWTVLYDQLDDKIGFLYFRSSSDGWAFPYNSFPLHWDGHIWSVYPDPLLNGVRYMALWPTGPGPALDGWAWSEYNHLLRWDGSAWHAVSSAKNIQSSNALAMLSPDDAWLSGYCTPSAGGGLVFSMFHWDGSAWNPVNAPASGGIRGLVARASHDVWVLGEKALLHWDGSAFQAVYQLPADPPIDRFSALALVPGAPAGWAFKEEGGLLRWDGVNWTSLGGLSYGSQDIALTSPTDGWMVRSGDLYRRSPSGWTAFPLSQKIVHLDMASPTDGWAQGEHHLLRWDGAAWNPYTATLLTTPLGFGWVAMDFLSPTDGWAAGGMGTVFHWDGAAWSQFPGLPMYAWGYTAIDMASPTDGWIISVGGPKLHWDGSQWNVVTTTQDKRLNALSLLSTSNGWAVGYGGAIQHWDGSAWTDFPSPTTQNLNALSMLSAQDGWAAGDGGVLLHWDGVSWGWVQGPAGEDLRALAMASSGQGWALSSSGTLLEYGPSPAGSAASGKVTRSGGAPLAGVRMLGSLGQESVLSSAQGAYTFTHILTGTCTIAPRLDGWVFQPVSRTLTTPPGASGLDFIGFKIPHADLHAAPAMGLAPLVVNFTNTTLGDYSASLWRFGDGITSTIQSPTHTYAAPGVYTVTLQVAGPAGPSHLVRPYQVAALQPAHLTLSPGAGGVLTSTNWAMPMTIQAPPGAVTVTTVLTVTPLVTVSLPAGKVLVYPAFDLSASPGGDELAFSHPMTVTVHYRAAALDLSSLALLRWDGAAWSPASACDSSAPAVGPGWLSMPLCRAGRYALFGSPGRQLFLPQINR